MWGECSLFRAEAEKQGRSEVTFLPTTSPQVDKKTLGLRTLCTLLRVQRPVLLAETLRDADPGTNQGDGLIFHTKSPFLVLSRP